MVYFKPGRSYLVCTLVFPTGPLQSRKTNVHRNASLAGVCISLKYTKNNYENEKVPLVALFTVTMLFNACKKDDVPVSNADVLTTSLPTRILPNKYDLDADLVIEDRGGSGACPTVTFAQPEGHWPNTITIDFGASCTRPDGRVLSGKLIVNQTDNIRTAGAVRTITHDNFVVDDVQVAGTRTGTNNGQDTYGFWSHTKTATITRPLSKQAACRWISQGRLDVSCGERSSSLDFGSGDCARLGQLTTGSGDTFTIRLRR